MTLPLPDLGSLTIKDTSKPQIEIGFDFGTATSAGAMLSLDMDFGKFAKGSYTGFEVYPGARKNADLSYPAYIPSRICYQKDQVLIGWRAKAAYDNDCDGTGSHFEMFKLCLDRQERFAPQRIAIQNHMSSTRWKDEQIIQDFICELFRYWKEEMKHEGVPGNVSIRLHCAVPAAWNSDTPIYVYSRILNAASHQAELAFDRGIQFWPEPVAASHYMMEYDRSKSFRMSLQERGGLCVCDCGGGTVDSIIYDLSKGTSYLHEVVAAKGVLHGAEFIDREMRAQIEERLRGTGLDEAMKLEQIRTIMWRFRELKETFSGNGTEDDAKFFIFGIKQDDSNGFRKDCFIITKKHVEDAFRPVLEGIWEELLEPQICEAVKKGVEVHTVALVGGFSSSGALRKYLKSKLESLSKELRLNCIKVIPIDFRGHALAEGAIRCSRATTFAIRRINRYSIGIIQMQPWDPRLPGHPDVDHPPERDSVTNQYWIAEQVKYVLKKDEPQADPDVEVMYVPFAVGQDTVRISVPLLAHETSVKDNYSRHAPQNEGLRIWHTVTFEVSCAHLRDIKTYDEDDPEPWIKELLPYQRRSRPPRTITVPPRAVQYNEQKRQMKLKKSGTASEVKSLSKAGEESTLSCPTNLPATRKKWHTVEFHFKMHFVDGVHCQYTLECPSAIEGKKSTVGVLDSSWTSTWV